MLEVNKEKCIKCYKCLKVCPFTVIEKKEDGFPALIKGKTCLKCMHCAATCPTSAYTFDGESTFIKDDVYQLSENFSQDLEKHIFMRRSYRHFEDRPVEKEVINKVLDTVNWAPSAKNINPTKWIVINSKEVMQNMMDMILEFVNETGISPEVASEYADGNNVVMGTAHTLIIGYSTEKLVNPVGDTYIATTTAELMLQSMGIGTCWGGYLMRFLNSVPGIQRHLPEVEGECTIYTALMVGYPKDEQYVRIPVRIRHSDIKWVE